MRIQPANKIYAGKSSIPNAGLGVFASSAIRAGEVIERCPIIAVPLNDPANNDAGKLVKYFFYFGGGLAVALGFGSLYNHSYTPNATYEPLVDEDILAFRALRDIASNEEITVNYNHGNPDDKSSLVWMGIPPFATSALP